MLPSRKTVLCIVAGLSVVRLVAKSLRPRRNASSTPPECGGNDSDVKANAQQVVSESQPREHTSSKHQATAPPRFTGWHALAGGGWLAFVLLAVMEYWRAQVALAVGVAWCALSLGVLYLQSEVEAAPLLAGPHESPFDEKRQTNVNLSGIWVKDNDASDSLEPVLMAMQLNPIVRAATRLVRGLELTQTENSFRVSVFSVIRWFKIHEEYPMSGIVKTFPRRDLRKGKHRGSIAWVGTTLRLTVAWDDPLGGWGTDDFTLISHNELHVKTSLKREGQDALQYNIVYRRKA
ncbi:hypothetical protein BSKO_07518 [Bryopsis sp. KO-2023]|nr:hypothetical protein BSKO_07518 [Bryopsis sp. KO-2023]